MGKEITIEPFDVKATEEQLKNERVFTVRLPNDYKVRYDTMQSRTRGEYSERIRNILMKVIDQDFSPEKAV